MKVGITGSHGLAEAFGDRLEWRNTGIGLWEPHYLRIEELISNEFYRNEALSYNIFINCAHVNFHQIELLALFFEAWKDDPKKTIINISSRAAQPNISKGYVYAAQKAGLNHLANNLTYNSEKKCKITTINLGLMNSDELPSLSYREIVQAVKFILTSPFEVPDITIQHPANYQEVQEAKKVSLERKWIST